MLKLLIFFASFNLVLLVKVLPLKKVCILFSWMYFSGHVSITSHGRKWIGFDQYKMFRDAGNLVLMEHSCLCCLIICANNLQNSFRRLFYRYIHMHVIGSTLPFLHSWHFKKSTLSLWIWHAAESITSDSNKITLVAKRQIEVSSTSTEVSFIQQNLSN